MPKKPINKIKYTGGKNTSFPGGFALLPLSWNAVKFNLITIIELVLIPTLLSTLTFVLLRTPAEIEYLRQASNNPDIAPVFGTGFIASFIASLVSGLLIAPVLSYTLYKSVNDEKIDFLAAIRQSLPYFVRITLINVAVGLLAVISIGLILVPELLSISNRTTLTIISFVFLALLGISIVAAQRFILAPFFVLDKDMSAFSALKQAARAAKKSGWALWRMFGVMAVFAVVSVIPIIGTVASLALTIAYSAAPALRYLQFKAAGLTNSSVIS